MGFAGTRRSMKGMRRLAVFLVFVSACASRAPALAQEKAEPSHAAATPRLPSATSHDNSDYRVGVHDVLEIRVYGQDDLSRTTEVTSKGTIGPSSSALSIYVIVTSKCFLQTRMFYVSFRSPRAVEFRYAATGFG